MIIIISDTASVVRPWTVSYLQGLVDLKGEKSVGV